MLHARKLMERIIFTPIVGASELGHRNDEVRMLSDESMGRDCRAGRRRKREQAAAFIEFAMIIVPLILIVAGLYDFGRYLLGQHILKRAVEAAANELKKESALRVDLRPDAAQSDKIEDYVNRRNEILNKAVALAVGSMFGDSKFAGGQRLFSAKMDNHGASAADTLDAALIMPGDSVTFSGPAGTDLMKHPTCPDPCPVVNYQQGKRGWDKLYQEQPLVVEMRGAVPSSLLRRPLVIIARSLAFYEVPPRSGHEPSSALPRNLPPVNPEDDQPGGDYRPYETCEDSVNKMPDGVETAEDCSGCPEGEERVLKVSGIRETLVCSDPPDGCCYEPTKTYVCGCTGDDGAGLPPAVPDIPDGDGS